MTEVLLTFGKTIAVVSGIGAGLAIAIVLIDLALRFGEWIKP